MSLPPRLAYERRVSLRQAVIAGIAGVALVAAAVIQFTGPHTTINEVTLGLLYASKRQALDIVGALASSLALIALGLTLAYLFGATRARNPGLHPYLLVLSLLGGALSAISSGVYAVLFGAKAHEFATHGTQTYEQAHQLTSTPVLVAFQYANLLGALLIAMALWLVSFNAMRVGLLPRFMGYLGIFAAALTVFPLVQVPVVEMYWLFGVAYLLSGRWPSGLPPAWRSGRAEPWPSSAEMRERRVRDAGAGRGSGRGRPSSVPEPAPQAAGTSAAGPGSRTRSTTPKRKRKRRR